MCPRPGRNLPNCRHQETARYLRAAHEGAENLPEGMRWTGAQNFHELAEAYEAKATLYKMLLETLEDDKEMSVGIAERPGRTLQIDRFSSIG
eukprot:g1402.t1